MPKLSLRLVLYMLLVLSCNVIASEQIKQLQAYVDANYGVDLKLSNSEYQSLTALSNQEYTPELVNAIAPVYEIHPEIIRVLNRLYALRLLQTGTISSYSKFVAAQSGNVATLGFESYLELHRLINTLSAEQLNIVRHATLLATSSWRQNWQQLVLEFGQVNASYLLAEAPRSAVDSAEYMADSLRAIEFSNLPTHLRALYIIFAPKSNLRHMLYTEGGVAMFRELSSMLRYGYMQPEDLNLWFAYWVVNIAGFRGHVANNGSLYLNQHVFDALWQLRTLLYTMADHPNSAVLEPYLFGRAKDLGYDKLPAKQALLLAHWAAICRIYSKNEAENLLLAYQHLPHSLQIQLAKRHQQELTDPNLAYPRFLPALFANALAYHDRDIREVFTRLVPKYLNWCKLNAAQASLQIRDMAKNYPVKFVPE